MTGLPLMPPTTVGAEMVVVESVGTALADFVFTWPGRWTRRSGEDGGAAVDDAVAEVSSSGPELGAAGVPGRLEVVVVEKVKERVGSAAVEAIAVVAVGAATGGATGGGEEDEENRRG